MKQKIIALVLGCVLLTGLCSGCGKTRYADHLQDYVNTMEYHDGFTILQLTDIHWDCGTPVSESEAYLRALVAEAEAHAGAIDLIEITGDTFMLAEARSVTSFIDFMTELNIPYALVWGNHDRTGTYNPNWFSEQFLKAPNCLYLEVDNDDVHGRSNYVINLTEGDETVWQILNLDSGASLWNGLGIDLGYDYIRRDQMDWMIAQHAAVGALVPTLCYYHIPQLEMEQAVAAWPELGEGVTNVKFFKHEGVADSGSAPDMTETFLACNVKGVFLGHDHANDITVTLPCGVVEGYGVKSGRELYYTKVAAGETAGGVEPGSGFDLLGASLVTLTDREGGFTLEHLYFEGEGGYLAWESY